MIRFVDMTEIVDRRSCAFFDTVTNNFVGARDVQGHLFLDMSEVDLLGERCASLVPIGFFAGRPATSVVGPGFVLSLSDIEFCFVVQKDGEVDLWSSDLEAAKANFGAYRERKRDDGFHEVVVWNPITEAAKEAVDALEKGRQVQISTDGPVPPAGVRIADAVAGLVEDLAGSAGEVVATAKAIDAAREEKTS